MNEGSYIPSKDIPYLFEPFYRVDKSRTPGKDGLGLGLNICKEIVSGHNGKLQVSSKKDLGTTFKVTLLND
jgi:two-component system sensor histidine kinase ResE